MKFYSSLICCAVIFNYLSISAEGNVDPVKLLAWVDQQKAISSNCIIRANGKDMNNGGTGFCTQCSDENSNPVAQSKTISLFQSGSTIFFDADMDIDCDGSDNGVCGGTDPSHENMLSCDDIGDCSVNNNGPVDPSTTPFYVLPGGSPFNFTSRGIDVGQLAAVINRRSNPVSITYGPLLDEDAVGQEIGEASAAMAQVLGIDNDPSNGGTDTGIVYIIFTGNAGRFTSISDMANHQKAITTGQSLAAALIASNVSNPALGNKPGIFNPITISRHSVNINTNGGHSFSVFSVNGEILISEKAQNPKMYDLSNLKAGTYILKINTENGQFSKKILIY
jgi:hypothetical protein